MLRLGKNLDLKFDTSYFSPEMEGVVEVKEHVKDLGVYLDKNLNYKFQRQKIVQKLGFIFILFSGLIPFYPFEK